MSIQHAPRRGVTEPADIEAGTEYRVYHDGTEIDRLRFVGIYGSVGYAVRSEWDEPERIHLHSYLSKHTVVPVIHPKPDHLPA